ELVEKVGIDAARYTLIRYPTDTPMVMDIDLLKEPLGYDQQGIAVYLKDIWPSDQQIADLVRQALNEHLFKKKYHNLFQGDDRWNGINVETSPRFPWDENSTYIKNPPYFDSFSLELKAVQSIKNAKILAIFGDSITTDHISPAGDIAERSPAGDYLIKHGITKAQFNSYGSRRGNHEVMMRGTFANIRLKNKLAQGKDGGFTTYLPSGELMSIYDASIQYQKDSTPLIIVAGKEYGSGSSRDWAAKGTRLLGVRAVIAESYERIHRSNLIGMGVLPLQFLQGENLESLGLSGIESISIDLDQISPKQHLKVTAMSNQKTITFNVLLRLDTPKEVEYINNDGILPYVVRQLFNQKA
ncbi:aconitate hydratase, partial [bacterium]|nr:aconitate hydratase [bacterium]